MTYLAHVRVFFAIFMHRRIDAVLWSSRAVLQLGISIAVWRAVADAANGSVAGVSASGFVTYFAVAVVVRELTRTNLGGIVASDVRSGLLATYLLRPFHPLLIEYAKDLSFRITSLLVLVPCAAAVLILDGRISTAAAVVAATLLPIAMVVRGLLDALIATVSLRVVHIDGLLFTYGTVAWLLSGMMAPLAVYPPRLEQFARLLPFYWTLGFPVELAVGQAQVRDVAIALPVLLGWMIVLALLVRSSWRRGVRAHEAVGQ